MSETPAPSIAVQRYTIASDTSLQSVRLKDIRDEVAPQGEQIPAENLVDRPFQILRGKAFGSRFSTDAHAYFVVGVLTDTGELFNTVLGGQAVVEVLDAWSAMARGERLEVVLHKIEGGKYGKYYVLE